MQFNPGINNDEIFKLISSDSRHTKDLISKLPEDQKVQIAVQLIIEGKTIYFTCGHAHSQSPFRLELRDRVVKEVKKQGYEIVEQEDLDDGSSIYGPEMSGFLDGIYVHLKKNKIEVLPIVQK